MLQRFALLVFLSASFASAATAPKAIAPDAVPHPVAMFLANLSADGKKTVTFKAKAAGRHFFFQESSGVTVYAFDGVGYRRETFLKGLTLAKAVQKYGGK